ncbi:hypothetical protein [Amycolatopsis pittospori]|uniref:hypothetical protein n=1 Tax=Amycolatopsis pittospori TaxID=2749434 RepID=UPI0015F0DEE5|nr:hypothetical protein [Amycolatopsis pittospori]
MSTLEDGLAIYPLRSIKGVRFEQATVTNTAVTGTASTVLLRVSQSPPGKPDRAWELAMPPEFARYLAAQLDAQARYIQTAPPACTESS